MLLWMIGMMCLWGMLFSALIAPRLIHVIKSPVVANRPSHAKRRMAREDYRRRF